MRTTRRLVSTLVATAVLAVAAASVTVPDAEAQTALTAERVAFGGVNGPATAVRAIGDQLWVGGEFDTAYDPDHSTAYARSNLAVFDFNTGEVLPFTADTDLKVKAIESDDVSTVWVAGNFTQVRGAPQAFIVAFDLFSGAIKPGFSVVVDYEINALLYVDGQLYVGGEFGEINGRFFNKLARVDAETGAVDTSFAANPTATVRAIAAFGDRVYAAGQFETVGKPPNVFNRRWVAGFDAATGLPAGPDFVLAPLGPGENITKAGVYDIFVSPDGAYFYTGDKRNFLIQWNRLTGEQMWSIEAEGDIQVIDGEGGSIYAGTHDGLVVSGDGRLVFALNAADGSRDDTWAPVMDSFLGTWGIDVAAGALAAVGYFTTVNGESSPHLAVFHSPAWVPVDPLDPPPPPLGDVSCDRVVGLLDALLLVQYWVGSRTASDTCPLADPGGQIYAPGGDVNADGMVNLLDALLIIQCQVGVANVYCP